MNGNRILVIDDDALFLEIVRHTLESDGHSVETVDDPRVGLRRVMRQDYDLILLDLMMPSLSGEEVLELLKPLSRRHRVAVVSAHGEEIMRARTRDLGAAAYLQKPVDPDDLRRLVDDLTDGGAASDSPEFDEVAVSSTRSPGACLSRIASWVYEDGADSALKAWSAAGVVCGLVGVAAWLLLS
jgi:DNA-binding response OmpR family regulator